MAENAQTKVAVIGLGAQGLVAVKNMLEQGFDVTGYEKDEYVGGIWHYSAEHRVSALPTTVVNVSRERACFTDFAFPYGTSSYPSSAELDKYLNAYCSNFDLWSHLRLGHGIRKVERDNSRNGWTLTVQSQTTEEVYDIFFDKLIVAVGPHSKPSWPTILEKDKFRGEIVHAIQYKDPAIFQGKRVMVVGISNTAADTSTSLVGVASKVYLSHRHGALIVPRYLKSGKSLDHDFSYRTGLIKDVLESLLPTQSRKFLDSIMLKTVETEFGKLNPQWKLTPTPSLLHQVPTVSEKLIPALRAGTITSTAAPKRVVGDYDVELQDGSVVQVDVIICCTGYDTDYRLLGEHDPTLIGPGQYSHATPQLYQNIFSLQYPHSLAFVGIAVGLQPAPLLSDLSTMAIAQLWSSKPDSPKLPNQVDMEAWFAEHLKWASNIRAMSPDRKFIKHSVQQGPWMDFVQGMAGTNVGQHLNYTSLEAWKFWVTNPRLCKLLMDGIWSPHLYRLFPSDRRKTWPGARDAIEKVNADVKKKLEQRKQLKAEEQKKAV